MEVETFEDIEVSQETLVATEEALLLIKSLGLYGQETLISKNNEEKFATRTPYRMMTPDENFTYRVLCPERCEASEYRSSAIPLRVLQVLAHAKEHFGYLEIWDRESAAVHDPILIGREGQYTGKNFILARWGEVLEALPVLYEKALYQAREKIARDARKASEQAKSILARAGTMEMDDMTNYGGSIKNVTFDF